MSTYWAENGEIHMAGRVISQQDALALFRTYVDEVMAAIRAEDPDAAYRAFTLGIELHAASIGAARQAVGLPMAGKALHHLDGDPLNNDLSNLRVVDIRENRGRG